MTVYNSSIPLPEGMTQEEVLAEFFEKVRQRILESSMLGGAGICAALNQAIGNRVINRVIAQAYFMCDSEIIGLLSRINYTEDSTGYFGYLSTGIARYVTGMEYPENAARIADWKSANWVHIAEYRLAIIDLLEEICNCVDLDF